MVLQLTCLKTNKRGFFALTTGTYLRGLISVARNSKAHQGLGFNRLLACSFWHSCTQIYATTSSMRSESKTHTHTQKKWKLLCRSQNEPRLNVTKALQVFSQRIFVSILIIKCRKNKWGQTATAKNYKCPLLAYILLKVYSNSLSTKAPLFFLNCPLFSKWYQT